MREYKDIDRVEVNYPGKLKLFPISFFSNLGDWGYDELTSVANGLLRHEILFSSGATITINFRQVSVRRKRVEDLKPSPALQSAILAGSPPQSPNPSRESASCPLPCRSQSPCAPANS